MARASRVASRRDEGIAVAVAADPGAEARPAAAARRGRAATPYSDASAEATSA